jgi:hypothetical protein
MSYEYPQDYVEFLAQHLVHVTALSNIAYRKAHPDTEDEYHTQIMRHFGDDHEIEKHYNAVANIIESTLAANDNNMPLHHGALKPLSIAHLSGRVEDYFNRLGFVCDAHEMYKAAIEIQRDEARSVHF